MLCSLKLKNNFSKSVFFRYISFKSKINLYFVNDSNFNSFYNFFALDSLKSSPVLNTRLLGRQLLARSNILLKYNMTISEYLIFIFLKKKILRGKYHLKNNNYFIIWATRWIYRVPCIELSLISTSMATTVSYCTRVQ